MSCPNNNYIILLKHTLWVSRETWFHLTDFDVAQEPRVPADKEAYTNALLQSGVTGYLRLHGAAAARRVHAAVHRTGVDLARRAFDALMRAPLGQRGSWGPTVLNAAQCIGWSIFELLIITDALRRSSAARIIGHCSGSRPYAICLNLVLRERRASSAIAATGMRSVRRRRRESTSKPWIPSAWSRSIAAHSADHVESLLAVGRAGARGDDQRPVLLRDLRGAIHHCGDSARRG